MLTILNAEIYYLKKIIKRQKKKKKVYFNI
jgi:hypothetical protein